MPGLTAEGGVSLVDAPLVLSDFVVPSDHTEIDVALITSGRDAQGWLYRDDTNLGTLEDGTLEISSGYVMSRIRDRGRRTICN